MSNHLNMSEEEVDAEIEKMQQQLTLALQQIDENFADCNQNFSKVLAEIDQYGEASQQMRDKSQKWLYFLETMANTSTPQMSDDETEYSTNRPVIDSDTKDSFSYQHRGDITNGALTGSFGGRLRQSLRKPLSSLMDTTTSGLNVFNINRNNSPSTLSDTSSLNRHRTGPLLSPPRIMPMGIPSSQLEGTPIREQAILLTENKLRSVGIHSSDSGSDGGSFQIDKPSQSITSQVNTPRETEKVTNVQQEKEGINNTSTNINKAWETSNMDTDDTESRSNFVKFLAQRNRLEDLPDRSVFKQPYLPGVTSNKRYRPDDEDEENRSFISDPFISVEEPFRSKEFTPIQSPIQQQEVTTYEFSDGVPQYNEENKNYQDLFNMGSVTDKSTTNSTKEDDMNTASLKPAQFDLRFFPEQFRTPPGSIKLRRVYNEFNKRPGTLLTVKDIMTFLNDPTFEESSVYIFIKLLKRKKFLKQVGDRKAWVIRT